MSKSAPPALCHKEISRQYVGTSSIRYTVCNLPKGHRGKCSTRGRDTSKASTARSVAAARRRFERYAAEMIAWGCHVDIPADLVRPKEGPFS